MVVIFVIYVRNGICLRLGFVDARREAIWQQEVDLIVDRTIWKMPDRQLRPFCESKGVGKG